MPCSISGQSKPAPGPPQPWMKLPASSNSSTGGAALSFWSRRTVLGRCRIHALPCSSIETLDTWPHSHLLGILGHDGSTSKRGISRGCAAAGVSDPPWPSTKKTAAHAEMKERVVAVMSTSLLHRVVVAPVIARGGGPRVVDSIEMFINPIHRQNEAKGDL